MPNWKMRANALASWRVTGMQATVAFGLSRPEFGAAFADFLNDLTAMQKAAQ